MDKLIQITPINAQRGCLFRIPNSGGRVLWQLTNLCNYSCLYCIFSSGPTKIAGELELDQICGVLDQLHQANYRSIKFTGGEPLVRKDLIEILKHANHLGIKFDLSTNASLLNARTARELAKLDPEMIHVSLDGGDQQTHDSIRGRGTFEKTVAGIKQLTSVGVNLRVGCVVFRANEDLFPSVVSLCHELKANEVIFSRMEPLGAIRGTQNYSATRSDISLQLEVDSLREKWRDKIKVTGNFHQVSSDQRPVQCPGGERFLFIDNLGFVSPCSWALENSSATKSTRSLKCSSLSELLNDRPMVQFREQIARLEAAGQLGCPYA